MKVKETKAIIKINKLLEEAGHFKERARKYVQSQFVKYVILSNGNLHYFGNIYKGNPQVIVG